MKVPEEQPGPGTLLLPSDQTPQRIPSRVVHAWSPPPLSWGQQRREGARGPRLGLESCPGPSSPAWPLVPCVALELGPSPWPGEPVTPPRALPHSGWRGWPERHGSAIACASARHCHDSCPFCSHTIMSPRSCPRAYLTARGHCIWTLSPQDTCTREGHFPWAGVWSSVMGPFFR